MPIEVLRPASISSSTLAAGSVIGNAGTTFYIKVQQHRLRGRADMHDVTGDGDPGFEPETGLARHALSLNGVAIADQNIGFGYLGQSRRIPVTLLLSATRQVFGTVTIFAYDVAIDRRSGVAPLALSGYWHNEPFESAV